MSDEVEVQESSLYTKAYIKQFGVAVLEAWVRSRDLLPWEFLCLAALWSERGSAPETFRKNRALNNSVAAGSKPRTGASTPCLEYHQITWLMFMMQESEIWSLSVLSWGKSPVGKENTRCGLYNTRTSSF